MKLLALLLFITSISFGQISFEEFANKVFSDCRANNIINFKDNLAGRTEIGTFLRSIDPSITDGQVSAIYPKYEDKAIQGFKLFQDDAAKFELDFTTIEITKTEIEDHPLKLEREGKLVMDANTKTIKIFFTCSGKNLCFMIYDAINVNGKWFLGEQIVQLHWLD